MSSKKWHINNDGDVKPCSAKKRCRFGGDSGFENHFTNYSEALENSTQILAERFGEISASQSKKNLISTEDRKKLIEYGLKDTGKKASTYTDVVEKGFKNDKRAYERFKKLSVSTDSPENIKPSTKESIGKMISKGINVKSNKDLKNTYEDNSDLMNESDVDVIGEDSKKITLEDLFKDYGKLSFGRNQ